MTRELKLFRLGGSGKAWLFSKTQKGVNKTCAFYLPKSQLKILSRKHCGVGQWEECIVEVPEWLVHRRGLT